MQDNFPRIHRTENGKKDRARFSAELKLKRDSQSGSDTSKATASRAGRSQGCPSWSSAASAVSIAVHQCVSLSVNVAFSSGYRRCAMERIASIRHLVTVSIVSLYTTCSAFRRDRVFGVSYAGEHAFGAYPQACELPRRLLMSTQEPLFFS